MRCRSIVLLVALTALLAPADWAAAQRGGRGGRPGSDLQKQPPVQPEEKTPAPPSATGGGQLATLRTFPHPFAWAAFGFAGAPP